MLYINEYIYIFSNEKLFIYNLKEETILEETINDIFDNLEVK